MRIRFITEPVAFTERCWSKDSFRQNLAYCLSSSRTSVDVQAARMSRMDSAAVLTDALLFDASL